MENKEMDLTLKLGLANPTVETHVSSNTPVDTDQGSDVDVNRGENNDAGEILSFHQQLLGEGVVIDDNEGASNNVDVNIRVYNYIFKLFAGTGETLNFSPFPMPPSPSPAPSPTPETPVMGDYVLIDVPAGRARRNSYLTKENPWNADANAKANATVSSGSGGKTKGMRRCTNRNCNTASTPMWRRGPLGSKTLCNACGIKFRKEELKIYKRK